MRTYDDFQSRLRRSGTPATFILIGVLVVSFLAAWFTMGSGRLGRLLSFELDFSQPWGLLTFPFASQGDGRDLFFFLLMILWFYFIGTSVERDLGIPKYLGFFFGSAVLAAIFMFIGSLVLPAARNGFLFGPSLVISALTVAWGFRNPRQQIMLYMIIPVSGLILAWLSIAITLFGFGSQFGSPLMGAFACLHLGVAYLFATNKLPGFTYAKPAVEYRPSKAQMEREKAYFDDVKRREQEREERERLRQLFERSMRDDNTGTDR